MLIDFQLNVLDYFIPTKNILESKIFKHVVIKIGKKRKPKQTSQYTLNYKWQEYLNKTGHNYNTEI